MTTEEFWNKYINENILEIFDITCDFFSEELPNDFIENYDVGEVILETIGHNETAKEFDRVLRFTKILHDKQPGLYEEYFQYFDEFLIDYYCFQGDSKKVEMAFSRFMKNPVHDFDKYLISFRKILYYGYSDLLNKAIINNYDDIAGSDKLIGGADHDLIVSIFYLTLEDFYKKNSNVFDKDEFSEILSEYGFDFSEVFLSSMEQGLFKQVFDKEYLINAFINDRQNFIIILHGYFLKYMKERGFNFSLSGRLWDKMLNFWVENNDKKKLKPDIYFKVNAVKFEQYLAGLSTSLFLDNKPETIATLWGSVYIYDFLKSIEIISPETHITFKHISKVLKGKAIGQFTADLWNSDFVHTWKKPDSISNAEFSEEEKIFGKSISFKRQKFTSLRKEISEELANIGELSRFIIEGGKNESKEQKSSFIEDLFNQKSKFGNFNDTIPDPGGVREPIRIEQKVGRNAPCPCGSGKKYKKCCGEI